MSPIVDSHRRHVKEFEGGLLRLSPRRIRHDGKTGQADLDIFLEHWLECGLDDPNACQPQATPAAPEVKL